MKRLLVGMVFFGWGLTGHAQSFGQMLETMLQQIAALQGYITTAEKGYQIAEDGLHTIREIKNGEFNLHTVFFHSLVAINSRIADMVEVGEIIGREASMIGQFSRKMSSYRQSTWLQPSEIAYIGKVYKGLVTNGEEVIKALTDLITGGQLTMTDGERIQRIHLLDTDTREEYRLVRAFTNQTDELTVQRKKEGADIGGIKGIYGIP